ncbi:MAG: hypothetical protein WDZ57_00580 [Demequina sp.]
MPTASPPAWLLPAYSRAAQAAGATASEAAIDRAGSRLLERWADPERKYHNVRHLVDFLQHVDELQQETHHPPVVRLAAWYHGAVFDAAESAAYARRGGEDEAASAEYARTELAELGIPQERIEAVTTMVQALARHETKPASIDCAVLCDADLAILAAEPQRYRTYVEDVRAEYAHIPTADFLEARRAIVSRLLKRDKLYVSPLGSSWERQARENLTAELARIDREIASATPSA